MKRRIIYIIGTLAAGLIVWYALCLPRQLFDMPVSAVLESSDGTLLGARTAADGQWRFSPSDSVPEKFANAIITYEDKRFRHHPGVDLLAIGNAIRSNWKGSGVRRGASTLTMQTIRLSRGARPRTLSTKLAEAILATRLELRCTKDEILLLYASNAPFGGNVVGLDAAAWRYFGRPASELSWAESAMLAILPNSPSLVHPGKNRDRLIAKRNSLLDRLCTAGIIDSLDCALAKEEQLPDKPFPMPDIAPHYLETIRAQGGDRLYRSSIDPDLQRQVQGVAMRHSPIFRSNKVENMAAVVLSVATGEVLVYCGNNPDDVPGQAVDVVMAPRSSGSTLKPFLYGAMLDEGLILPTMLISDIPFHYKNFSPRNYNNTFDGAVTARSVIQRSLNVPSVRMLDNYGVEKFILLLKELGFSTINRGAGTYGLSLILGGAEITLWDLAKAYRGIAAQLHDYPVLGTPSSAPLSSAAVWCTFDALSEVNRPEEEGLWKAFSSTRRVAWKTGTSYGNRDAWSVGVTPDYVVAVWVGNCTGEGRPRLTGVGYAAPLMFDIFSRLPATGWFDAPEVELEEAIVCRQSGHPLSEGCTGDTISAPIAPQHPEVCPYHHIVHLSADGRYIVNSDCYSVAQMKTVPWFVLPPAQEWYYMRSHSDYRRLPPYHPQLKSEQSSRIDIIYPQNGMRVAAPVDLDSKSRGVVFSAVSSDAEATLYWHIDSDYIGSTSLGEHKLPVIPSRGRHVLTVISSDGGRSEVVFYGK